MKLIVEAAKQVDVLLILPCYFRLHSIPLSSNHSSMCAYNMSKLLKSKKGEKKIKLNHGNPTFAPPSLPSPQRNTLPIAETINNW